MINNGKVEIGEVAHVVNWRIMKDYCVNSGLEILEQSRSIYGLDFQELWNFWVFLVGFFGIFLKPNQRYYLKN